MRRLILLVTATASLFILTTATDRLQANWGDDINATVNRIADLLEKGDTAAAKKEALNLSEKGDLETIMSAMKPRNKKGIGVGSSPNGIIPDGIELKLEALVRDGITPAALTKEGAAIARTGSVMAAIAHVAIIRAPEMDVGKLKKADWLEWSQNLVKASQEFSAAAKGTSAADLKKAASKVKQNCDSCHAVFR